METPRRDFLLGAGMAAGLTLSGCVSDETIPGATDDATAAGADEVTTGPGAQETVPGPETSSDILMNKKVTIDGNEYIAEDFSLNSEVQFRYRLTVKSNIPVDLFVVTTSEFIRYKQGKRITPEVLEPRINNDSGDFTVPQGNYYVVVDNTDRLEAEPPGQLESKSATVDIEITY
ncbi:hypothetical protein [Halorientalis regularis]|jgi:hypothetical protein|uniref:Uncharacterized protein n=1 Tax=Halorientalis regularis TaxID=660518 RepID=A0A1G7UEN1_9EURY|nr:hypothetical protein [Halorientalis regularis]SDG45944.1 hypothetical protein SAMN05216218_1532 [Halorientalis regularis]